MATTPDYTVNYEDERLTSITDEESKTLADNKGLYSGMIGSADKYFDDQINATKEWEDKQTQIQKEQTDFAIQKIEQQKDQANKDYKKEQSGAYVDWQKQSNQYGVEAEKMASSGLTGTGYSESSQVSMYNTYQNRVATAREVYNKAVLNYDNAIQEAILQNNATLAEIAYQSLQKQLELSLQGFQYKNQLLIEQSNKELEIKNMYHNQWMDALNQINTENALAEDVRQYNETMKWNTEQKELDRQFESKNEKALLKYEYSLKNSGSTGITGYTSNPGARYESNMQKNAKVTTNSSKTTTSNTTVNSKSKLSLGQGPISDKKAAQLVNDGKANATVVNGQVYLTPAVSLPTSKLRK